MLKLWLFLCCIFCLMIGSSIGAYCDVVSTLGYNVTSCFQYNESNFVGGNSGGTIKIPAVFVSEASGETLAKYVGPTYSSSGNSTWCKTVAISFIIPFAMSAFLATCFVVRRHRVIRRESTHTCTQRVREFHTTTSTSSTCAVCLEDYNMGEKLTTLPCLHKFHAVCVKAWVTTWRTFCPVCKRDARSSSDEPPASESTPLLMSSTMTSAPAPSVSCSRPHHESHSIYTHRPLTVTCPQYSPFMMRSHFRVIQPPPSLFK